MATLVKEEMDRENMTMSGGPKVVCANCRQNLSPMSNMTAKIEQGNMDEEQPIFEISLDIEEIHEDPHFMFRSTQRTTTIKVKDALSAVYKLMYLDMFTNSTMYIVQDNFLEKPDEDVAVCPRCAGVLTNLFKFYNEFNQLRQVDTYLSKRVELLDVIIQSQVQLTRSQDFNSVVPSKVVTEVIVEVDGEDTATTNFQVTHVTDHCDYEEQADPSYSESSNCQVVAVVSEQSSMLPPSMPDNDCFNSSPSSSNISSLVLTEALPTTALTTTTPEQSSLHEELLSHSPVSSQGVVGPWVKLHRMTAKDVEKARVTTPTSVNGRPSRIQKLSRHLNSDFVHFGDASPLKEEGSDSEFEFEGNENSAAEDGEEEEGEEFDDNDDDEPFEARQQSTQRATKYKSKTKSRSSARSKRRRSVGTVVETIEATIPCTERDKMFRRKFDLKKLSKSFKKSSKRRKRVERLKCQIPNCLVTFSNVSARNTHMKIYHPKAKSEGGNKTSSVKQSVDTQSDVKPSPFSCPVDGCLATFSNEPKRALHIKRNHQGKFSPAAAKPAKFKCEKEDCSLVFRDAFALEAHVRKKHLGLPNPYECKYCKAEVRTRDLLYEHIKSTHPNYDARDGWSCKLCVERYKTRRLLQEHMRSSHPDSTLTIPSWPCFICLEEFRTRDERTEHLKEKHPGMRNKSSKQQRDMMYDGDYRGNEDNLCPQCGKTFPTRKQFTDHCKYHGDKNFKCDVCEKGFVRAFDLKRHQVSHSEEKNFICETCGKSFKDSGTLLYHHSKTCGPRSLKRPEYKCSECGIVYKNKKSLDAHVLDHKGLKVLPYKCDLCEYRVRWPGILKYHRKKHFSQQEFTCDLCPAKFKHKNSLSLHRDVRHFGIRGKNCSFDNCDFVGMDKQSLEVHVRMKHTKERPFSCSFCGQGFMKNSHKNRHEFIHIRANSSDAKNLVKKKRTKPAILAKRVKLIDITRKEGVEVTSSDNKEDTDSIEFVDPENVVEFYEVVV